MNINEIWALLLFHAGYPYLYGPSSLIFRDYLQEGFT